MKLLTKIIGIVGLSFILFGCAQTGYQSGRLDQQLAPKPALTGQDLKEYKDLRGKIFQGDQPLTAYELKRYGELQTEASEGSNLATKEDLRELKRLQDNRKHNQDMWDTLDAIIQGILVIDAFK